VLAASQFLGTLAFGAVLAPFGWVPPSLGSLSLFLVAGCISVCALLCVNRSLKLAPASHVVPYQYSMIIWAVLFGVVVFGDVPSPATLVGAAIIIAAGLYIFLCEQTLGRSKAAIGPTV
jgi:drug/metabolite transporter (DMT)-like permease